MLISPFVERMIGTVRHDCLNNTMTCCSPQGIATSEFYVPAKALFGFFFPVQGTWSLGKFGQFFEHTSTTRR